MRLAAYEARVQVRPGTIRRARIGAGQRGFLLFSKEMFQRQHDLINYGNRVVAKKTWHKSSVRRRIVHRRGCHLKGSRVCLSVAFARWIF